MPPSTPLVGIVGKTNVGKSTLFAALTLTTVEISNRPFTTIDPNIGVAYVKKKCVHEEFGVKCNPVNSLCINGYRFIPVKIMDVAGLIPGAHQGKGLGNKFLDDLRKADVLIHVVDASGSTSPTGEPATPGSFDPIEDVEAIEKEVDLWFFNILSKDWDKLARTLDTGRVDPVAQLAERLSGLSITKTHVIKALEETGLGGKKFSLWSREELFEFAQSLRRASKPMVIAANKADLPEAEDNIKRMKRELRDRIIIPTCAEAELALRRASKAGLIDYVPGDTSFKIVKPERLTPAQLKALEYIEERVFKKWGTTGVQEVIDSSIYNALNMIVVYPVEDANKLTDHHGNVLPDAYLVKKGTTARELAYMIHTDLGESFLYAIDARTKNRLGEDYVLKDNDVIKIVAGMRRKA